MLWCTLRDKVTTIENHDGSLECARRVYRADARETTFVRHRVAEPRPLTTMMGPPRCAGWCTCLWPMNKRMAEDRKRDIRDEVEFRQAQLNAQAQRLRGTVHMYLRDARMFVEQRDDEVARKMLVQKAMMEQRIAVMATHWSVLESVRVSLQPSEVRLVGDLVTCRAILNKTGLEFIEPVRLDAPCPTPHPSALSRAWRRLWAGRAKRGRLRGAARRRSGSRHGAARATERARATRASDLRGRLGRNGRGSREPRPGGFCARAGYARR